MCETDYDEIQALFEEAACEASDMNDAGSSGMDILESALSMLSTPDESDWLGSVGVWFWQNEHYMLAMATYLHARKLKASAPLLFNLAVCSDDTGDRKGAVKYLREFYSLVENDKEKLKVEKMLVQNGKEDLIKLAQN